MSTSKVFFVRNLIVLVPFYAILAARGICWLFSGTRHAFVKIVFSTTTAALIIFNVFVIVGDALEVRHQNSVDYLKRTLDYINRHPSQVFLLSPLIQKQASVKHEKIPSNTRSLPDATEINSAVFYYSEIEGSSALEVGKLDQTKWFGPPFVNYNYYPTWPNTIRIMIMPIREAKKFNLFHAAEARS